MTLERSIILSVSKDQKDRINEYGEIYHGDPNRTRYLYGPSAFLLKKGEAYVSQKELFFTSAAYGISDNVSMLVGSVLPILFTDDGFNLITALKVGGPVYADKLHLATGFETLFFGFQVKDSLGDGRCVQRVRCTGCEVRLPCFLSD